MTPLVEAKKQVKQMPVHVFVGPTLPAVAVYAARPGAVVHPPVRHGDLLRLSARPGETVVLVDGYYHQSGAVRHKEILDLLAADVRVVGCASMGALRAAELHPFGMIGHGTVFGMYRRGVINGDDEVAVSHGEEPDYRSFSIPLVTVRCAVAAAVAAGAFSDPAGATIVGLARELPYHERSWRALASLIGKADPTIMDHYTALRAFLADHPVHADIKATDTTATLRQLDELTPFVDKRWAGWPQSTGWRSQYLHTWRAEFGGAMVAGRHVSAGEVARYRQIYHDWAPRAWRRHVLARIAGLPATAYADQLAAGVMAAAARHGLTARSLTIEQRNRWMVRDESERPAELRHLLCALVRSYRPALGPLAELIEALDIPDCDADRWAVAECQAINEEVASWGLGHRIEDLRDNVLLDHLFNVWHTNSGDTRRLLAAARDRGFQSIDEAIHAVRPFFLRHRFERLETESGVRTASVGEPQ